MRRTMWFAALVIPIIVSPLMGFQRGTSHTILGVVTDARGSAVTGASVAAIPVEEGGSAGDFGWTHTDDSGKFRLVLRPGRYVVRAKDETNGYPDPSFLLCSDQNANFPQISVEQSDISDVRVVLGARGGILQGNLRDEATLEIVPKGKVTIRDARQHDVFVEVVADEMGRFQFTVPNKPIQVLATASGYGVTYYGGGEELVLSGGEHRSVMVGLNRK